MRGTAIAFAATVTRPAAAVALREGRLRTLEQRARIAAQRTLTAANVSSPLAYEKRSSELTPWLKGGLAIGIVAVAIGGLLLVVDTVLRARGCNAALRALGMSARQHARLEAMLFAVPFWSIAALSGAFGLAFTVTFVAVTDVGAPFGWLGAVLAFTLAAGVAGAGTVARSASR